MAPRATPQTAAIGFRVKTARATAVLLQGPATAPKLIARHAVELWDPKVPASRQPYHAGLESPQGENAPIVRRGCEAAERVALRTMRDLVDEVRRGGHDLRGIGLVVTSDTDAELLKSAHVRAHAFEGRLFREILEAAAASCGLPCLVLIERQAFERAAGTLGRPANDLRRVVTSLGTGVPKPWGAEEKTASLAAWLALRSR